MHKNQPKPLDEAIELIKYSLLVDGVTLSKLSCHFVTKFNQPIFLESIALGYINSHYTSNIRRSLCSHQQHHSSGKSSYTPLPEGYNPYTYFVSKSGLEDITLPPFTYKIWKSVSAINNNYENFTSRLESLPWFVPQVI